MKNWSRSKKVIGILVTLIFIFLAAYFIKNIDFYYGGDENDSYAQGILKYGNYFYVKLTIGTSNQTNGKLVRVNKNGKEYKTISNDVISSMTVYKNNVYYSTGTTDSAGVYKMSIDGTKKKKIYFRNASEINYYKRHIYFIDDNSNLCSIDPDGNVVKIIAKKVEDYTFYKNNIYYSTNWSSTDSILIINKVNLNGGNSSKVCSISGCFFRVVNDRIYYLSDNTTGDSNGTAVGQQIYSSSINGKDNKKMSEKIVQYYFIFNDIIYLCDNNGKCYSADLNFSDVRYIISNCYIFCTNRKKLYYIDYRKNAICSMDKNGKKSKKVIDLRKVE